MDPRTITKLTALIEKLKKRLDFAEEEIKAEFTRNISSIEKARDILQTMNVNSISVDAMNHLAYVDIGSASLVNLANGIQNAEAKRETSAEANRLLEQIKSRPQGPEKWQAFWDLHRLIEFSHCSPMDFFGLTDEEFKILRDPKPRK